MNGRIITSDLQPDIVEYLDDNTYYYNYNIQKEQAMLKAQDSEELEEAIKYSYIQIHLTGTPNYATIVEGVIRAYLTSSEEFNLINSYNKLLLLNIDNEEVINNYKEYLELLDTIKATVKNDLLNL